MRYCLKNMNKQKGGRKSYILMNEKLLTVSFLPLGAGTKEKKWWLGLVAPVRDSSTQEVEGGG